MTLRSTDTPNPPSTLARLPFEPFPFTGNSEVIVTVPTRPTLEETFPQLRVGVENDNNLTGAPGDDTLVGHGGFDRLDGGDGNDILAGGAGDDTLVGGNGVDTTYYAQARSEYALSSGANNELIIAGPDGTDTLTGVEKLHFANPEVYRFYNDKLGTHFYTGSADERDTVIAKFSDTLDFEGVAYHSLDPGDIVASDLYRFLNTHTGTHFYTASAEERDTVIKTLSDWYSYEGVAMAVSKDAQAGYDAVYRFYNAAAGTHFYTASVEERDNVVRTLSDHYTLEGVSYYVPHTSGVDNIFAI